MSGRNGPSAGSVANRSQPAGGNPSPPAPLIAPTGSPGIDAVLDVVNNTVAPFTNAPPPEQGVAGEVSQKLGGVLGVIGAPEMLIDTAFAALTAPIAALFPSLPAVTLLGMHVGVPHAHMHPPSLIPPAPPVPLPSIGMLMGAGAITVLVGGIPAARAGDIGISVTCGSLAPPFEVFTGSSNVFIGGARAARILDITKHCNPTSMGPFAIAMGAAGAVAGAAGAIATGSVAAAAQTAANAAVMALQLLCGKDPGIPPGMGALLGPPVPNVLIGGFPCPPIGQMAMGALMRALKQAIKNWKKNSSRPSNGHCGEAGEPIYLVTGENFSSFVDFVSGGLFEWRRHYTSARSRVDSPLGHGWRHFYQRSLSVRLHRATFTDWDGETIEFPRFERGASVTRAAGRVLRRLARGHYRISHRNDPILEFIGNEFDGELLLTRVLREDRELALTYDRLGRLSAAIETQQRSRERRRYEFHYAGDDGHILEVIEGPAERELGRSSVPRAAYTYTERNDLDEAHDALRGRWRYEYNGFHCLTRQTDPRNYSYWYKYDGWQRCIETSGQDGLWWAKAEYFPEKGFTRLTEGEGALWEYHYESDGFISKVVDPYGGVRVRERDANGQVTRDVDSGGREMRWLYDGDGANCGRIDRFGNFFPPALEMPHLPDPFARKLPSTSFEWQLGGPGELRAGPSAGFRVGLLEQLPEELAELGRVCFGRTRPRSVPGTKQVERDELGRKTREIDELGRELHWKYDPCGNLISKQDPDGRRSTQSIVRWNLIGEQRDALGHAMRYDYSRLEEVVGVVDPLGNETRYDYDHKKRLIRVHRHGKVREEYVYDLGDHFIEKRDGTGQVLFRNEPHANHFVKLRHLASGGFHRFDYDGRGRIVEASTQDHEVRLKYDGSGLAVQDVRDGLGIERGRAGSGFSTRLLDRFVLTSEVAAGQVELTDPTGQRTLLQHDTQGFVRRTCANNTVELLRYDNDGRLDARLTYRRDWRGYRVGFSTRYVYSAQGDLLRIEDSARGTTNYETDAAHRLVGEWSGSEKRREFRLDAAGNVIAKPGLAGIGIGRGNQLSASADETFLYNSRDHLAERQHRDGSRIHYVYDSFDMLVRIERSCADGIPAAPWEAAYDAISRRLWSRHGDSVRSFYWDGDRLAAEVFPDGGFRVYQYASRTALTPLAFTDYPSRDANPTSGRSFQVFSDPVGMPLCIEDDGGEIVWWADRVDPYGQIDLRPSAKVEYNLRWPGHYYDPETGLHYNRYRYYDPRLGRYLQSDPVGYSGSPVNLYTYCPNPLVQVDVLGLTHKNKEGVTDPEAGQDKPPKTDQNDTERQLPLTKEQAEAECREKTAQYLADVNEQVNNGTLSERKAGPVVAGVVDHQTGEFSSGLNTKNPPNPLHPVLESNLNNLDPKIGHYSKPGTHAEVNALNDALWKRDPTGTQLKASDLDSFTGQQLWRESSGTGGMNAGTDAPRCGNCSQVTQGVNNLSGDAPPQPEFVHNSSQIK